jgi:hypothetical protein
MVNINTFSGVGVAGMSWTLHVPGTAAAAAHVATGAQAIMPRRRRTAAATVASVNRGTT